MTQTDFVSLCSTLPPTPPPAQFNCVVDTITAPCAHIRVLRLRIADEKTLLWRAGQYADLTLPGVAPRSYSIANAPDANGTGLYVEFHIRNTGGAASAHIATTLKPGDTVTMRAPMGHATLAPGCIRPVIAIAGGMGLSPMKAIIESALNTNHPGPITLYWGANNNDDLYCANYFRTLANTHPQFKFVAVVRDDDTNQTNIRRGLVGDAVIADYADLAHASIFVAGPPQMVTAIIPQLLSNGANRTDIHTDDSSAHTNQLGRTPQPVEQGTINGSNETSSGNNSSGGKQ